MALRVIQDYPEHHLGRRLWRRISSIAGGVLLVLGLTASIPALPTTLLVVSFVAGWVAPDPADPWPSDDVPARAIVLVWAISTAIAIFGCRFGLRLLRRHRTLVLFLRRFGHDEAQAAVTYAVLQTIGGAWRIVTLDDAEMAPIGVHEGARRLFQAGRLTSARLFAIAQFAGVRMFPQLVLVMWGTLAIALIEPALGLWRTGGTTPEVWIAAADPFLNILFTIFEGRLPLDRVAPTLPGIFAVLAITAALSFVVMIGTAVALLLAFPLGTLLLFLSSSSDAIREAERSKTLSVHTEFDIQQAANAIARRSRRVFGPRLVVLRVASNVWQQAVKELAALSSLPLIDISEPTINVLWEIEELTRRFGDACVLIGHHERVLSLATSRTSDTTATPVEARLVELLHDREVLTYATDRRGLARFARALRGMLLSRYTG